MKTLKLLLVFVVSATLFTSCYREEIIVDSYNPQPNASISLNQLLNSYELWYVDINETIGYGETPFLQIAFTVSFRNGNVFANNNLVGIGSQGNGFGIQVGNYDAYNMILDVYHVIDGYQTFDVYQINNNTIELYNPNNDTSYFLIGYQRANFDYDYVFYDNIHYFLQEYVAWENTATSDYGEVNPFDKENFLQFLPAGGLDNFRSSKDPLGTDIDFIYWDYEGVYNVTDDASDLYIKYLTLDYDFFSNEFFNLSVIDDGTIELLHAASGTVYEFKGRGYIEFLRTENAQGRMVQQENTPKKRKQKTVKKVNPRTNTRS